VLGYVAASSGVTDGVRGASHSTSGAGVVGYAYASSGYTYGVYGHSFSPDGAGVFAYGDPAGGAALKAGGNGLIQSTANSYVFVPAAMLVKSGSADTTRLEVQMTGAVHVYRGATAGAKTVRLPITLPAVLYGQPVTVEQATVYYKCQNGVNSYISSTTLTKLIDADTGTVLISDSTDRTSNSATSYTLVPTSGNALSSEQGLLCLSLTLEFANDTDYVRIAGARLRLSHQ